VIITGINLRRDSDAMFWKAERCPDIRKVSAIARKFLSRYKRAVGRMVDYNGVLTLANARNMTSRRCEVNMTRK